MFSLCIMMLATAAPTHAFALPVRRPLGLRTPLSSPHLRAPIRQSPLPVHPLSSVGGVALRLSGGSCIRLTALAPTGFNAVFLGLVASVALLRTCTAEKKSEKSEPINPGALSLQRRFLAVFWLFRLADWLQVRLKCFRKICVAIYTTKETTRCHPRRFVLGPAAGTLLRGGVHVESSGRGCNHGRRHHRETLSHWLWDHRPPRPVCGQVGTWHRVALKPLQMTH